MGSRSLKTRRGYAWTWEFEPMPGQGWHLCHWTAPTKAALMYDDFSRPSEDARPVRVELVPTSKRARTRYGY